MRVRMGQRNFRARRNGEFKYSHLTVGVFAFEQEANFNLPGSDALFFLRHNLLVGRKARPSRAGRRQKFQPEFLRDLHHAWDVLLLLRAERTDFLEESLKADGVMTHMSRPGLWPR